jgi:hypothetical protein
MTGKRYLDVTANTTLDHVDVRVTGKDLAGQTVGVLDVESPKNEQTVELGLELDSVGLAHLPHHAQFASLTPDQARTLANDLEAAAVAAERDESMTSGRGRS